ncbi:MAG TPA: rhamnogalacturonan acetylesterase [Opitutales bacterium]|nr:rhamnogalacturonan acetylesterase [Opitutales bacterium]
MTTPLQRACTALACAWLVMASLSAADVSAASAKVDLKFSFGPQPIPGYTQVKPDDNYTPERGYGFDLSSTVSLVDNGGGAALKSGYVTGAHGKPFFFSVKLNPGIYEVKVTLGDAKAASTTTVKAETRRLMLEAVTTKPGEMVTREFYTHLRVPQIPGAAPGRDVVRMKPRENKLSQLFLYWEDGKPMTFTELDWDEKLTLEFSDARPALDTVEISTPPIKPVKIYLVGDSTMTDQMMEPWGAWGMQFPRWLKPPAVVINYAESGESAVSFIGELRWPKLLSELEPGDYVLIQFGINDRAAGLDRFKQALEQMVADTKAKGAIPVLVTSQNLRSGFFGPDGQGRQTLGDYPRTMWDLASEQKTWYIDLNSMSTALYEAIGQTDLPKAFVDTTHQNAYGSYELSKCVMQACIDAKLPFAQYVVDDWKTFDPKHPDPMADFKLPPDPQFDPTKLPGGAKLPTEKVPVAGQPGEFADPPTTAATAPMRPTGTTAPSATGPRGSSVP